MDRQSYETVLWNPPADNDRAEIQYATNKALFNRYAFDLAEQSLQ